jgi:hypothetical protein
MRVGIAGAKSRGMSTFMRSLSCSLLLLVSLAATACDVAPEEAALDEEATVEPYDGTFFFSCDKTAPNVTYAWPAGWFQIPLTLPPWEQTLNLCGRTTAQISNPPGGNIKIIVDVPRTPAYQGDELRYTIYGLPKDLCSKCTSPWIVLANGVEHGFWNESKNDPMNAGPVYPQGQVVASGWQYSAFRVAASYVDAEGVELPTKATFKKVP